LRVPSFDMVMRYAQGIGLVICGMVIGSAVFMMIYQHNFNELIKLNVSLQTEIEDLQSRIEGLSKDKDHSNSINTIQVSIEKSDEKIDEIIQNELRNRVKKSLNSLVGQSADTIDPRMARELFGEKLYPNIHDRDYIVNIRTMLISQGTLHIWISIEVYQKVN
jgi:predicted Holliday junction resolvase-like endonuclease